MRVLFRRRCARTSMSRDALVSCALLCAVLCALLPARHGAAAADVEGTPCVRGRFNGTCVLSKRCETLILDYRDRSFPPVCGLRGKEPIVCCTDCELVDNIDNIYLTRRYSRLEKTNKKSWDGAAGVRGERRGGAVAVRRVGALRAVHPHGGALHLRATPGTLEVRSSRHPEALRPS